MFMENKEKYEITFKLQSNNVNLENLKSSETSKIASDFLKSIEKADKNIKLKMIKFGSIACTLEVNKSFTENKIFQKVKENIRSFITYNNSIEWVDIVDKSNEVIETIKNSSLDENISLNVVGFFQGRVNDIGGKEPNNTDIDQLAKVISKVENNPVLSERIENAINLSNNEIDYVTPDENGIVYSQTVDLQQVLADKLGQNKKIVSNYFYSHISIDLLNIMFSAPSVISRLSVYNSAIFNSSSILFYGNKIKIKSLENTTPIYET